MMAQTMRVAVRIGRSDGLARYLRSRIPTVCDGLNERWKGYCREKSWKIPKFLILVSSNHMTTQLWCHKADSRHLSCLSMIHGWWINCSYIVFTQYHTLTLLCQTMWLFLDTHLLLQLQFFYYEEKKENIQACTWTIWSECSPSRKTFAI